MQLPNSGVNCVTCIATMALCNGVVIAAGKVYVDSLVEVPQQRPTVHTAARAAVTTALRLRR